MMNFTFGGCRMRGQLESGQIRFFRWYSLSSAVFAILAGLLVLFSRRFGLKFVENFSAASFMKSASALCFALLGLSLLSFKLSAAQTRSTGIVVWLSSYIVLAIGITLLLEYFFHLKLTELFLSIPARELASVAV